ncbi:MAG: hypothetical protein J6K71_02430 [Clostridia bacterium]|nr:hypothetical protein [Clostridia bacterium]
MKDQNDIILNSRDLWLFVEPESDLIRLAIYNHDCSRIKFLHNNKVYERQEVLNPEFQICKAHLVELGLEEINTILSPIKQHKNQSFTLALCIEVDQKFAEYQQEVKQRKAKTQKATQEFYTF